MKLNQLEWTAERLASNNLFGEKESEALKCFRNLVATLRTAYDLPTNFESKDIDQLIWKHAEEMRVLKAAAPASESKGEPVALLHRYPSQAKLSVEFLDTITEVKEGTHNLFL